MKRKVYIQILGVLSCLAVVALHTNGCFWDFSYDRYWLTANVIENICYFAVPIFFMISGATLMDYRKRYSTAEFFKKRFWKTVIPFLIWSVFGILWTYFNYGIHPSGILDTIQSIGMTKYVNIYWFFPALFSVYPGYAASVLCTGEDAEKSIWLCYRSIFCRAVSASADL